MQCALYEKWIRHLKYFKTRFMYDIFIGDFSENDIVRRRIIYDTYRVTALYKIQLIKMQKGKGSK